MSCLAVLTGKVFGLAVEVTSQTFGETFTDPTSFDYTGLADALTADVSLTKLCQMYTRDYSNVTSE